MHTNCYLHHVLIAKPSISFYELYWLLKYIHDDLYILFMNLQMLDDLITQFYSKFESEIILELWWHMELLTSFGNVYTSIQLNDINILMGTPNVIHWFKHLKPYPEYVTYYMNHLNHKLLMLFQMHLHWKLLSYHICKAYLVSLSILY